MVSIEVAGVGVLLLASLSNVCSVSLHDHKIHSFYFKSILEVCFGDWCFFGGGF